MLLGVAGRRRPAVQKRGKTEYKQPIIGRDNLVKLKSKMAPKGDHEVSEFFYNVSCISNALIHES